MPIREYRLQLLDLADCSSVVSAPELLTLLRAWRRGRAHASTCSECGKPVAFPKRPYAVCCQRFYFSDGSSHPYPLRPIVLPTPGYPFLLNQLERMIQQAGIASDQDFLPLCDPIFWQMTTTLSYERVARSATEMPSRRSRPVCKNAEEKRQKARAMYEAILKTPLNYGSLESRSCGKATLIRQVAFGKRCRYSMRGMIVPDATLRPNEIRIPDGIVERFGLRGQWILLNRMPSLQPENFVGLRVPRDASWSHDCFGIPLEILESINGDFDGDEANIYLVPSLLAQAECAVLLNPEVEMRSFVTGSKLAPCQDMLVAYYLFYDQIDFLPVKRPDLKKTLITIEELYGSGAAFRAYNDLRLFYLDAFQNRTCFALTWAEMETLSEMYARGDNVETYRCCLTIQILSGAKGTFANLEQMFGSVGVQSGAYVESSFMEGLTYVEAVSHGRMSLRNLQQVSFIWLPGYGYQKVISNAHDLKPDYEGRIVDGTTGRIVFLHALDAYYHEDILSAHTFQFLLEQVLVGG